MKRLYLILMTTFCVLGACSQIIEPYDRVIHEKCYTSYYSDDMVGPSYVVYKLYKGGGKVSRRSMEFTSPYVHFRYHNAVPMTPQLNRGKWLEYEKKIRVLSQTDSLLIICGGCDYYGALVPRRCFKIVKSLSTGKVYYSLLFDNKRKGGKVYWWEIKENYSFFAQ